MIFDKIKASFRAVKLDINALKSNVSGWVIYLNKNQRDMRVELQSLKQRIRKLETEAYVRI